MPHTATSKSERRQRKALEGVVPRFMSSIKCTRTSSNNTDHINNDKLFILFFHIGFPDLSFNSTRKTSQDSTVSIPKEIVVGVGSLDKKNHSQSLPSSKYNVYTALERHH
ncbi:hypothetical protein VNO80_28812 [Phaseolus coccineus]|uniref:Uncharacterized protein n=1 Tax=Phaseolus coccineus TaxID=3886 RepID=A0AAN9L9S0_PHACN